MPNGRTSLFQLTKADFGRLLADLPDEAEIAKDIRGNLTTSEVRRRLDEHEHDGVTVDEQDHAWYIVMFMKPRPGPFSWFRDVFQRLSRSNVRPNESPAAPASMLELASNQFNWVTVGESSPLHGRLRQHHAEWLESRRPGDVVLHHGRFLQFDGKEWRAKEP